MIGYKRITSKVVVGEKCWTVMFSVNDINVFGQKHVHLSVLNIVITDRID